MPTQQLSTKAPHNNSTGFLMINIASTNIPIRLRKSTFLCKDPFDGQYMETRSFDIEGRRGVKVPHRGGSHLWTVWQLPTEDNFQDKKFWRTYKLPGKIFLRTERKKRNGALLREGSRGLHIPPSDKKVRL